MKLELCEPQLNASFLTGAPGKSSSSAESVMAFVLADESPKKLKFLVSRKAKKSTKHSICSAVMVRVFVDDESPINININIV